MDTFVAIAEFFGLTPANIVPLVLVGLGFWFLFLRDVKQEVNDLHYATKEIQNHLLKSGKKGFEPTHVLDKVAWAKSKSPFTLNERGSSLASESGMDSIIEENEEELVAHIELKKPTTGFDVEQYAFQVVNDFVEKNTEIITIVKRFIYNNPVFEEKEISLEDVYFVGSLILRDKYLKKHPEIV